LVLRYYRKIQWTFQPQSSEEVKFECIALTASSNISRSIEVVVPSEEFYIDQNKTTMEVETDETNPGNIDVTLNCTIVGGPVTYASFALETESDGHLSVYDMTPTRVNLSRTETLITVTEHFDNENYRIDTVKAIYCYAVSANNRGIDYEMFGRGDHW
ncbi:hypothetical protein EGW08_021723, partial [Elysia chlorotica]